MSRMQEYYNELRSKRVDERKNAILSSHRYNLAAQLSLYLYHKIRITPSCGCTLHAIRDALKMRVAARQCKLVATRRGMISRRRRQRRVASAVKQNFKLRANLSSSTTARLHFETAALINLG